MDLYILNTNFETVMILDTYESFIWTDRYYSPGDFEIYLSPSSEILSKVLKNYYIWISESNRTMIIESLEISSDPEKGNKLKITGRSLESILDRRVVWKQTDITGSLQDGIKKLINDSIIDPEIEERKISNFVFIDSTDDYILSLEMDNQFTGDNLLEVVQILCENNGIGFQILLNDNHQFEFQLYSGVNRTYDQTDNLYVIFSPEFDNLINSNYLESISNYKNVALVAGEGEGSSRKTATVGEGSDLERKELFVDARDISSTAYDDQGNSHELSSSEYQQLLIERGKEKLAETAKIVSFEGEVDPNGMFKYGSDFFIGDDVQIENEYGQTGTARIIEFIISDDSNGLKAYPTFQMIEEDEEDE